jgi:hypothetical protein
LADLAAKVETECVRAHRRAEQLQLPGKIGADIDRYIEIHVLEPQCLALCERMQAKLPRELRDQVYGHLLHGSKVDIGDIHGKLDIDEDDSSAPDFVHVPEQAAYARLFKEDCADSRTRFEFAYSWYRSTTFRFQRDAPFRNFLHEDYWGFGYDVRSLVQTVELVDLLVPIYERKSNIARRPGNMLQLLSCLRSDARIELSFPILTDRSMQFNDHMIDITHILNKLRKKGYKITIKWKKSMAFELGSEEITKDYWNSWSWR